MASSTSPLRVAHLGAGIFAHSGQGPIWRALPASLVTHKFVWSRTQASAASYASFLNLPPTAVRHGDADLDAILEDPEVDAVSVILPISLQPDVARRAMLKGKHVMTEKPLAGNIQSAREVIEAVRAHREKHLMYAIAENIRFEPALNKAAEIVRSGRLGQIITFDMFSHIPFLEGSKYEQTSWRQKPDHIAGLVLDSGVHFMALLRLVLGGNALDIMSKRHSRTSHLPEFDTVASAITMSCGGPPGSTGGPHPSVSGTLSLSYAAPSGFLWVKLGVLGEKGRLVVERHAKKGMGYVVRVEEVQKGDVVDEEFFGFEGIQKEIEAFVGACGGENGQLGGDADRLSVEEAFNDLAMVDAICKDGLVEVEKLI